MAISIANDDGYVIGVVSSSFDGGPSYVRIDLGCHEALDQSHSTVATERKGHAAVHTGSRACQAENVKRSRRGDVVMTMTAEESELVDAVESRAFFPRTSRLTTSSSRRSWMITHTT